MSTSMPWTLSETSANDNGQRSSVTPKRRTPAPMISKRVGPGRWRTNQGDQEQASNEPQKQIGSDTEEMHRHGNLGPLQRRLRLRHLAANQSAQRVRRNSARGPQSLVEPKWPDGAELHR
jgi:hypothetical protein